MPDDARPDRPPDDLEEARVGLQPRDVRRVLTRRVDPVEELADRPLLDRVLAECGQDVRDVVHERRVRPDHQHAAPPELAPVAVEQPRGPVQADGGLARPRPALDDQRPVRLGRDQPVLVGLDRRDDVAHPPLARPLELLEQEVGDGRALEQRPVEPSRR